MIKQFQIDDYYIVFDTADIVYMSKQNCTITIQFDGVKDPLRLVVANSDNAHELFNMILRGEDHDNR